MPVAKVAVRRQQGLSLGRVAVLLALGLSPLACTEAPGAATAEAPLSPASVADRALPPATAVPLGRECRRDNECAAGRCARMPDGVGRCTVPCAAGCPSDWVCSPTLGLCIPEGLPTTAPATGRHGRAGAPKLRPCFGGCDDGEPCTADRCEDGRCTHLRAPLGTPCDDGNLCTQGEACGVAGCAGGSEAPCDDGDSCTRDECERTTGCQHLPRPGSCDDNDLCTYGDTCGPAGCAGVPLSCDDGNPCTGDSCVDGTCVATAADGPCDDNNACTVEDQCAQGLCSGTARTCDDADPCTVDSCDPSEGCYGDAVDGPECDDGNACTFDDTCADARCTGRAVDCDDANPCTADVCDPLTGCWSAQLEGPCDDGDACTVGDTCVGLSCRGSARSCDDNNPCTTETCDASVGCVSTAAVGSPCDDGDACTLGDACAGTECHGQARVCDDGNLCTRDTCDPQVGCMASPETSALRCNDGNACTGFDVCSNGLCAGTPLACDDGNSCTQDVCSPAFGCGHIRLADGTSCSDGNACTAAWDPDPVVFSGAIGASGEGAACLRLGDPTDGALHFACASGGAMEVLASGVATVVIPLTISAGAPERAGEAWTLQMALQAEPGGAYTTLSAELVAEESNELIALQQDLGGELRCAIVDGVAVECVSGYRWSYYAENTSVGLGTMEFTAFITAVPTATDVCSAGVCTGSLRECDDHNACTMDRCNPLTGSCAFTPLVGEPCDDGSLCTSGDACDATGSCTGVARDCEDGNPCTEDVCDESGGCNHVGRPDGAPCDDGDPCTAAPCPERLLARWELRDAGAPTSASAVGGGAVFVSLPGFFADDLDAVWLVSRDAEAAVQVTPDGVAHVSFDATLASGPEERLGEAWRARFTLTSRGQGSPAVGEAGVWLGLVEGYQPAEVTAGWQHFDITEGTLARVDGGGLTTLFLQTGATVQLGATANGRDLGLGLQARLRYVYTAGLTTRFGFGEWAAALEPTEVPQCPTHDACNSAVCQSESVPGCTP